MKKALLIPVMAAIGFAGCSEHISESKLPSVVVNGVKTKYTSPGKIEWKKSAAGYEAEFRLEQTETTVLVDSAGNILMQKQELKPNVLPAAVATAIATTYKDHTIDEADKLERNGVTYYQAELEPKGSNKELELVFTADGSVTEEISYWK